METKLKELGLTDEQVKKAQEILKEEINGKYIPKERFDQVNNDAKATKAKLEELQKSNPEELNAKIKQLTDDLEKKNQEYLTRERDLLIDNQLSKAGVRNIKALKALLDMDKKKSMLYAILGVLLAGVIMMILSFGILDNIIH